MITYIQNLVKFCPFILKKLVLTSIKGHNSVANLRKIMIYNTNVDLVNVYIQHLVIFCPFILKIFKQKLNFDVN